MRKRTMNSSMAQKLATTPALAPPPGVVPDFVHPASINQEVLIISAICLALMMLFVTVRVCSKMRHTSTFGWDDCKPFRLRGDCLLTGSRCQHICNGKESPYLIGMGDPYRLNASSALLDTLRCLLLVSSQPLINLPHA